MDQCDDGNFKTYFVLTSVVSYDLVFFRRRRLVLHVTQNQMVAF